VGAENLGDQAIFVDDATDPFVPPDPEVFQSRRRVLAKGRSGAAWPRMRCARHGPSEPTGCSSAGNDTRESSWRSTSGTTTPDAATKDRGWLRAPDDARDVIFPAPPHQIRRRQLIGGLISEYQPAA